MTSLGVADIGVAIDQPALRRSVSEALARSRRYVAAPFDAGDVSLGTWPKHACTAVVTTFAALRSRKLVSAGECAGDRPVIVVILDEDLARDADILTEADAFICAGKIAALLPSAILLSGFGVSVLPSGLR